MVLRGGQHCSRMGRQRAMHNGEPGQQRHSGQYRRTSRAPCGFRHNRHQQHQAHLKEHRHADDDSQRQQSPGQAKSPAAIDQQPSQRRRAAGTGQETAQDRAQSQNNGDMPHQVAHA